MSDGRYAMTLSGHDYYFRWADEEGNVTAGLASVVGDSHLLSLPNEGEPRNKRFRWWERSEDWRRDVRAHTLYGRWASDDVYEKAMEIVTRGGP